MEYGFGCSLYPSQQRLVRDACEMVRNGQVGILSSPTGTGKTLSLLCTAISFVRPASDDDDLHALLGARPRTTVYYCSRTHAQLGQVVNELRRNRDRYSTVILGSRRQYCVNEEVSAIQDINVLNRRCRELVGDGRCAYYDGGAFWARESMDIEDLRRCGREHGFCPYYYARRRAAECEIVLLPYSLLFTREGRESLGITLDGKILIVDEAHNICSTVIGLNSAEVRWEDVRRIARARGLTRDLETIAGRLLDFASGVRAEGVLGVVEFLVRTGLGGFNMFEAEEAIVGGRLGQKNDLDAFFEFARFLRLLTFSDEGGRVFFTAQKIRFTPLSPAMYFEDVRRCRAVLFAGGTMEPVAQLRAVFPRLEYRSYPPVSTNFLAAVVSETVAHRPILLNHSNRDEQLPDVLNTLVMLTNPVRTGGIVVFVPSRQFLGMVRQSGRASSFRRRVCFEDSTTFEEFVRDPQILFAVMGGRLSEGINFSDDLCRLLIVVGVPFPTATLELEERNRHDASHAVTSAMNTVNQSIGRALRHSGDYAAIVLLDSRYRALRGMLSPWVGAQTVLAKPVECLLKINAFLRQNTATQT